VGLLVVLAAAVAVVGTMWFQKFQLAERRYAFFVRFDQVGGLTAGDPIHVNGLQRGKINRVVLSRPGVVIAEFAVREDVVVPVDSRIVLKSIGIMGERFAEITQGVSPRAVAPADTVDGEFLMGMSEVMGSAGDILSDVQETARSLREVAEILSNEGKLRETMENLADVSDALRDMMSGDDAKIVSAVRRFGHVAALMDSLVTTHYASLDSSMTSLGRAGGRLDATVDNLASVSDDLRSITDALRSGQGTAGQLIYNDELIRRLESTVGRVDSLIIDIKLHPGRYVTFKIF